MAVVTIARHGEIAVVTVDNPPVNALSHPVRQGLWDAAEALDTDPGVSAVVLACAGRTFIAGADVSEFGKPPVAPILPDLVARIEAAAKPWTALIHGSALGGGLEVALGCRFRLAVEGASVGLPEVALGLVPGASGTVRTPRVAGIAAAVELVTSARPVKAAQAQAMGLIDAVVSGDPIIAALDFARQALTRPLPPPVSSRPLAAPEPDFWDRAEAAIIARAPGEIAPLRALACLRMAAETPYEQALAFERETFVALRGSEQSAALRAVFFAERAAPRPPHLKDVKPGPLNRVLMTGDLSPLLVPVFQRAGLTVLSRDQTAEADLLIGTAGALVPIAASARADAVLAVLPGDTPVTLPGAARTLGLTFPADPSRHAGLEIRAFAETLPETLATCFALARATGRIPVLSGPGGSILERLLGCCRGIRDWSEIPPEDEEAITAALAAEGRALLDQGVARSASDIDLLAIHALGFPRWRGGPMFQTARQASQA